MIKVFIWLPMPGQVGHASAEILNSEGIVVEYVSWWPAISPDKLKSAPGFPVSSLERDIYLEERQPDHTIELTGLNEDNATVWWQKFLANPEGRSYKLLSKNCSWAVVNMIKAAGGDDRISWFQVARKYNIPIESYLKNTAYGAGIVFLNNVSQIDFFAKALKGLAREAPELIKKSGSIASVQDAFVAMGDALTSIWSPVDVLAYCKMVETGPIEKVSKL